MGSDEWVKHRELLEVGTSLYNLVIVLKWQQVIKLHTTLQNKIEIECMQTKKKNI